jgi:antigen KI-67
MSRSPRPPAQPSRRGGLALPTAVAAVVCGGSVLAIAAAGAGALGGGDRIAVEVLPPPSTAPEVAPSSVHTSNNSGLPPEGAFRSTTTAPQPVTAAPHREPTPARTASEYPVDREAALRAAASVAAAVAASMTASMTPPVAPPVAPSGVPSSSEFSPPEASPSGATSPESAPVTAPAEAGSAIPGAGPSTAPPAPVASSTGVPATGAGDGHGMVPSVVTGTLDGRGGFRAIVGRGPRNVARAAARPRTAPAEAITPKAAQPKAATPKAATPKAATPKAATPKAAKPGTAKTTVTRTTRSAKAAKAAKAARKHRHHHHHRHGHRCHRSH